MSVVSFSQGSVDSTVYKIHIPYHLSISYLHAQSTRREQGRCKVRHREASGFAQTRESSLF